MLLALTPPVAPLLVTAGFMAGVASAYCRTDAARRWRPGSAELGPLRSSCTRSTVAVSAPGVAAVLAVMLTLSIGFGQLDTSMAATAGERLGGTDKVGLLFAAIAGGSTVGGLAFGTRRWPFDERRAVAVLLALFAVFLAAMATLVSFPASPLWLMFPLLFLTGCTIAPTLIMQQSLLDQLSPAHRLNEARPSCRRPPPPVGRPVRRSRASSSTAGAARRLRRRRHRSQPGRSVLGQLARGQPPDRTPVAPTSTVSRSRSGRVVIVRMSTSGARGLRW